MAQESIIEKLNVFVQGHDSLIEECQVVYLMVEIRKILDHDRGAGTVAFPLLRFYCDWMCQIPDRVCLSHQRLHALRFW